MIVPPAEWFGIALLEDLRRIVHAVGVVGGAAAVASLVVTAARSPVVGQLVPVLAFESMSIALYLFSAGGGCSAAHNQCRILSERLLLSSSRSRPIGDQPPEQLVHTGLDQGLTVALAPIVDSAAVCQPGRAALHELGDRRRRQRRAVEV